MTDTANVNETEVTNEEPTMSEELSTLVATSIAGVVDSLGDYKKAAELADHIMNHPYVKEAAKLEPYLSKAIVSFKLQLLSAKLGAKVANAKIENDVLPELQQWAVDNGKDPSEWTKESLQAEAEKRRA